MLLKIDYCSICANNGSIFSALFTFNSLHGFVSLLLSSILFNCLLCSISCYKVSILIMSPNSVFFENKSGMFPCQYSPMLGLSLFTSPPILGLRGKNVVRPFLPFISLNDLLADFPLNILYLNHLTCLTLGLLLFAHLPNLTFVGAVQFPFLV